jgi:two-component system chemotaxis response regulator CheB
MVKNKIEAKKIKSVSADYSFDQTIIAIGASTGGPRALEAVLTQLPNELPSPILIVQHIPGGFTKSLAERLNTLVPFTVKEASDQEVIDRNTVYISPGDRHMKVKNSNRELVIKLSKEAPLRGHRPSVDVLFQSIADINNRKKIAVVLTGMGKDGAEGIRILKANDPVSKVIAEAQETAIIYGMPKAAVNTNCVDHELPLPEIGRTITNIMLETGGK